VNLHEKKNRLMYFNEYLLRKVIRIIMVDHHFANVPIDTLLISAYQQVKPIVCRIGITDLFQ
jgi:hypothetical protein